MLNKLVVGALFLVVGLLLWQLIEVKSDQADLRAILEDQADLRAILEDQADLRAMLEEMENRPPILINPDPAGVVADDHLENKRVDDLEKRLTGIEEVMLEVQEGLIGLAERENPEQLPDYPLPEASPEMAVQQPAQPRISSQERQALIDSVMNQTREEDTAWSTTTTTMIENTMLDDPALSVGESTSIDCASTLCRIETYVPATLTSLQKNEFQWKLLHALRKTLPTATLQLEQRPDGSQKLVYYMARKGHRLPRGEGEK
jgi:hypothetical protein